MFDALQSGIPQRAIDKNLAKLHFWNPRDFTENAHRSVDDRPYGGGPGMLLKVEPLQKTIAEAKTKLPQAKTIYLSPQGKTLTQSALQGMLDSKQLILIAGRYEGIDERLLQTEVDEEWSIGDYVLSGGELAAMVLIDAMFRLLPGALGHESSAEQDSFTDGLLDCPHYTRPEEIAGLKVPDILLQGHHQQIEEWRLKHALGATWLKRPDLLAKKSLNEYQERLLLEYIIAYNAGHF